jgi:hypothetical protein
MLPRQEMDQKKLLLILLLLVKDHLVEEEGVALQELVEVKEESNPKCVCDLLLIFIQFLNYKNN